MSITNKTLTIVGATGRLAVPVIHRLLENGVQVKAVVRNLDKARELLPENVDIVYGNVEDVHSLKEAFQGTENIYIHLNTTSLNPELPFYPEREGVKNIVDAAQFNGVKQIMQIGGIESLRKDFAVEGVQLKTSLIRDQGMKYIKDSGIPYTFLFCSFFVDSFPLYIQDKLFAIIGDLKHPLYFTNTSILAKNIYNAIGNPNAYSQSFAVQGKEGMPFPEAAKRFVKVYDPEVTIESFPLAALKEMGMPSEEEAFMEHMMTFVEQLKEEPIAEKTWKELGEPEMGLEAFAQALKDNQI
ncbi:SDR family oxidoreductase [Photobacterium sp. OFAV2-7]|uniref:SDR family oxidoreductase n=1 Tax=Photobacterium sp. OFAV2-7 TaxID=2917748 RepID=UPI001EF57109|nr:NAD(P)H-binding protein [Photobacterium sp. OFAV2-7]MCG7587853.1 NAD(P)H-binding protein [Photobacterium sp. OFAV2-7]